MLGLLTLVGGVVLSLSSLSKPVSGASDVTAQRDRLPQETTQQSPVQTDTVKTPQSMRPYQVLPAEERRLSQETIDQIDNLTVQQFVQFYNDTGLEVGTIGTVYFVNDPDDRWVLPSNNYVEGEFPIIGSMRDGSDQGWDNYLDGDQWTTLSYSDQSKATTIGQIKAALHDYFGE